MTSRYDTQRTGVEVAFAFEGGTTHGEAAEGVTLPAVIATE